jgi:GNAT superfamily N-acetyltransferase
MSPIERFSFIAIRRPNTFTSRLLMCLAGVKDLVAFDVYVDEADLVLGTTGLYRYKKDFNEAVWLAWFCVDPKARGRGIGQALLDHSVAWARNAGFRLMRLSPPPIRMRHLRSASTRGMASWRLVARKGYAQQPYFEKRSFDQAEQSVAARG